MGKPAKMSAQGRISQVAGHMNATGAAGLTEKHPDDVVVTTALRTAITKGGKGGFPESTAVKSLNRQCSSGLAACVDIANAIRTGMIDVGVGGVLDVKVTNAAARMH